MIKKILTIYIFLCSVSISLGDEMKEYSFQIIDHNDNLMMAPYYEGVHFESAGNDGFYSDGYKGIVINAMEYSHRGMAMHLTDRYPNKDSYTH